MVDFEAKNVEAIIAVRYANNARGMVSCFGFYQPVNEIACTKLTAKPVAIGQAEWGLIYLFIKSLLRIYKQSPSPFPCLLEAKVGIEHFYCHKTFHQTRSTQYQ